MNESSLMDTGVNRISQPKDKNINREITLVALLASGKEVNRWSDNSVAEIEGWVFDESENNAPRERDNWRATAWEIHPVTNITVIP